MVQFTDLPSDILDPILARLPDFSSLVAAIKASRECNAAFRDHRQTILTSVALNPYPHERRNRRESKM